MPKNATPPPRKNATHDDNHEQESCNDKQIAAPGAAEAPACFPELFHTSTEEIQEMRFTRAQWQEILDAERARERYARTPLITWIEKKLNGLEHPAIQIFQEEMQLYPRRRQIPDIIRVVGTSRLDFWREVVRAWKLCDYRPFNLAGMLECFEEHRIPGTRPDHRSHKDTTHHQSNAGSNAESPNEQQKHMRVSVEESNEFWLKKFYEQQEAKKREKDNKQERETTDRSDPDRGRHVGRRGQHAIGSVGSATGTHQ